MIKPGMRTSLTKEEVERRKRKEARLMEKMRREREQKELEEIRRKRQERDDNRIDDNSEDERKDERKDDSRDDQRRYPDSDVRDREDVSVSRDEGFQNRNEEYARSRRGDAGYGQNLDSRDEEFERRRDDQISRSRGDEMSRSRGDQFSRSREDPLSRSRGDHDYRDSRGEHLDEEDDYR